MEIMILGNYALFTRNKVSIKNFTFVEEISTEKLSFDPCIRQLMLRGIQK